MLKRRNKGIRHALRYTDNWNLELFLYALSIFVNPFIQYDGMRLIMHSTSIGISCILVGVLGLYGIHRDEKSARSFAMSMLIVCTVVSLVDVLQQNLTLDAGLLGLEVAGGLFCKWRLNKEIVRDLRYKRGK